MITCSRCGKENQDHYKFCLGCGNEIKSSASKPAAAPIAAPPREASAAVEAATGTATATGGSRDASERTSLGLGADPNVSTPPPQAPAPRPRGGIPWNDSPQLGAARAPTPTPSLMGAGGAAGAAAAAASAVREGLPGATTHVAGELRSQSGWIAPRPTAAPLAVPPSGPTATSTSGPAVVARQAELANPEVTTCPACGRAVNPGFAFCGSCGTRINAAPVAASGAGTSQRTMYMSGPAKAVVPRGRLILIRPDGSEGGVYSLHDGENLVGRGQGTLFDSDLYLSPRHAEFILGSDGLVVRDARSLNGVFVRLSEEEPLESGDIIRIGQELLRFEVISAPVPLEDGTEVAGTPNPGFWGRLSVIVGRDVDGSAFPLFGDSVVMGRERGDILFPEDGYVSGAHAKISLRNGRVFLSDVGSSNGTFVRVRGERKVASGAFVLMGQQLFRLEYK